MMIAYVLGFAIGFLASLPVTGPIAVGIVALGLAGRHREALGVSFGAALGETLWAALAFLGVGAVLVRWPSVAFAGELLGGGTVIALGVLLAWRGLPRLAAMAPSRAGSVALGLGAVLANVALPFQWSAAVALVAASLPHESAAAPLFGLGAGLGVFTAYAALVALIRRRPVAGPTADRLIRLCGAWLTVLGGVMVFRAWP